MTAYYAPILLTLCLASCRIDAPTDRPSARSWVLLVAEGVRVADVACAEVARARKDAKTAEVCARGYTVARGALIAAEASLDASQGAQWACSLRDALGGLGELARGIRQAGGTMPPAVVDAMTLGQALAGMRCSP